MQLAAPTAAEDGRSVIGVIPHEVEVLVGLEPLGDGGDLPVVESAVEVARHVGVDLVTMDTNQPQTLFPAKRWCAPFLKKATIETRDNLTQRRSRQTRFQESLLASRNSEAAGFEVIKVPCWNWTN